MELLIYRDTFDKLADALADRPSVIPVIMEQDGRLVRTDGSPATDIAPQAAFFSRELFMATGTPIREFLAAVHESGTVRWVQSLAAGYEHSTFTRLFEAGIRLTITDSSSIPIAEYVMAEVLACFQPIAERRAEQAAHRWTRLPFRELFGTRWLILGYGSIGQHVAARARAFGAEVVGVRRTPRPDAHALRVVGTDALRTELAEADVLVICAAANDGNTHLIDAGMLSVMRPGSVLVNVARGSILDTEALRAALDAGRPAQAVLDVFETEPLPADDPLWDHPSVRICAHSSANTEENDRRLDDVFLEHLDAWLAGAPMRLEVKPVAGQ